MKKIIKSILLLAAITTGMVSFVSCSDDDDLTTADALFRPIISESDNIVQGLDENLVPYVIVKWDNYTSANQYTVKMEATDGSDVKEITTSDLTCQFNGLQYDKEYYVYISSSNTNTGLSSKPYSVTITTIDYPTNLSSVTATDIIDNAARIRWSEEGDYDLLKVIKDSNDSLVNEVTVTSDMKAVRAAIVDGLQPRTTYRVEAYKDNMYKGKKRFTTAAAENFSGAVIDLRAVVDSVGKTYITTEQLAADVAEYAGQDLTYVLKGGFDYKVSGGTALPATANKIKFVTGLTLGGNARFIQSGGFTMTSGAEINDVVFEKIDFVSDKVNNGSNPVDTNKEKGWGGRQVFNVNGTKATMESLTYKNCSFTGYRAVCRAQTNNDAVHNITMEDCLINCIGDQGVITTTNKAADWRNVTMKNCTITNIVMLCDLRSTAGTLNFSITDCTFCYAPIETTANANTPLFRLGSGNVDLTIKNSLIGPTMATTNSEGSESQTYQAGVAGSVLLSGTPNNLLVENGYKTNFTYLDLGAEEPKIYPIDGLSELSLSETELWSAPSKGEFYIIGSQSGVDFKKLGDGRWR